MVLKKERKEHLNSIIIPLKTEIYINNNIVHAMEMAYASFTTNGLLLPKFICKRLFDASWETQFSVDDYNTNGLPLQITGKGFNASMNCGWTRDLLDTKSFGAALPNKLN